MKRKIIFTVTNDLSYDQRMHRICTSLAGAGYQVWIIGRTRRHSVALEPKPYRQHRLYCFFQRGKLFYAEYNLRLFFYLLFTSFDMICSVDLDTILPGLLVARLKRRPCVYDAHEYFTEVTEVTGRPMIKKAWKLVERFALPRLSYAYTVNESIAGLFEKEYGVHFEVIRNAPALVPAPERKERGRFLLFQGDLNPGRGLRELLEALPRLPLRLYLAGGGDIADELRLQASRLGLRQDKIRFLGYVRPDALREFTTQAAIGINIYETAGLNNYYSLNNKFFQYMHAGLPQIAMNYPEYRKINDRHEVALLIDKIDVDTIVMAVQDLLRDEHRYQRMQEQCRIAREMYNWQEEEKKLIDFYARVC